MKAYIQQICKQFPDDWIFAGYLGCVEMGFDIKFFEDINKVPENEFVISFIEDSIEYFKRCNIPVPPTLNIPFELERFANRKTTEIKLADFKYAVKNDLATEFKFPLFIKPKRIKAFSNGVITNPNNIDLILSDANEEETAIVSPKINIESEYRCFVLKNELIGIKHYSGDFTIFPSVNQINNMIAAYTEAPIAYTLDVGVVQNETIIIECNDAWSIGNYGLDSKLYVKMLYARWQQITKSYKL
jgi:hypothetical protein